MQLRILKGNANWVKRIPEDKPPIENGVGRDAEEEPSTDDILGVALPDVLYRIMRRLYF